MNSIMSIFSVHHPNKHYSLPRLTILVSIFVPLTLFFPVCTCKSSVFSDLNCLYVDKRSNCIEKKNKKICIPMCLRTRPQGFWEFFLVFLQLLLGTMLVFNWKQCTLMWHRMHFFKMLHCTVQINCSCFDLLLPVSNLFGHTSMNK